MSASEKPDVLDFALKYLREIEQLRALNADLLAALEKITAEVEGCAEMARECIGNTNVADLWRRAQEARAAIARARS